MDRRFRWLITTPLADAPKAQRSGAASSGPAVPLEHANVVLPAPAEYPGYNKFMPVQQAYRQDPLRRYRVMQSAWRQNDQTSLDLDVTIAHTTQAVTALMGEILKSQPTLKKWSLTGRKIGQQCWHAVDLAHLYIQDGYCLIAASMIHPVRSLPGRGAGREPLSQQETRFLEDQVVQTLDRLTVLGFTSRPRGSAPAVALKQVKDRIAAVEREKRLREKQPPRAR